MDSKETATVHIDDISHPLHNHGNTQTMAIFVCKTVGRGPSSRPRAQFFSHTDLPPGK